MILNFTYSIIPSKGLLSLSSRNLLEDSSGGKFCVESPSHTLSKRGANHKYSEVVSQSPKNCDFFFLINNGFSFSPCSHLFTNSLL